MTTLKKYNIEGKETGTISVTEPFENAKAHSQMVKDYIIALRENARQWSASTKTRSEVKHTTKKPWNQKGTGRARQGSFVSPQFKGGGIVFGPKPKFDQHVRINKKERIAAIRYLLANKIKNNKIIILEDTKLESPNTKQLASFLKTTGCNRKVLFLGEGSYENVEITENVTRKVSVHSDKHSNMRLSVRNIPKVQFNLATNVSGYDVLLADHLVVTESALNEIKQWLA